jgi:hypothetical protein
MTLQLHDEIKRVRRIAHPKAQDHADFQSTITAGICDWRNGLQYKFALQKSWSLSLWVLAVL